MSAKEINKKIEDIFTDKRKDCITYEEIVKLFDKPPTLAQAKNILKLAEKSKNCLYTSQQHTKMLNDKEKKRKKDAISRIAEEAKENPFDIMKERELLEWSRSDSPVRMYLREMGQIPLLTKEEEIEISMLIEEGEDIIIDAICSVPYLIDFILDYKEPLINRERRVKELFKSFDDEKDEDDSDNDSDDDSDNDNESDDDDNEDNKKPVKDDKRVLKVKESFKTLEKAKKEWLKVANLINEETQGELTAEVMLDNLTVSFKKGQLKDALLFLEPTSKLINELVRAMETTLKSDEGFEKELKRLEYKLPLFNDVLKENHDKILTQIVDLDKDAIAGMVPEATMVSTYMEIKSSFKLKRQVKIASILNLKSY